MVVLCWLDTGSILVLYWFYCGSVVVLCWFDTGSILVLGLFFVVVGLCWVYAAVCSSV